jgi:hypothetical protein
MCIEFLMSAGDIHPMTEVAKACFDYLSGEEPTEDGLKDYLADEVEAKRIQKCGCGDPFFKLSSTDEGYKVTMSNISNNGVYIIKVTKDDYGFEYGGLSDTIEDYDEIKYNEYID